MNHHDHCTAQAPRVPEVKRPANAIKDLAPAPVAEEATGGWAMKLVGIKLV
jgi:hypothetical protein